MKEDCFFLTVIKGQGGSEYYCDACQLGCEGCKIYVSKKEAFDVVRHYVAERRENATD